MPRNAKPALHPSVKVRLRNNDLNRRSAIRRPDPGNDLDSLRSASVLYQDSGSRSRALFFRRARDVGDEARIPRMKVRENSHSEARNPRTKVGTKTTSTLRRNRSQTLTTNQTGPGSYKPLVIHKPEQPCIHFVIPGWQQWPLAVPRESRREFRVSWVREIEEQTSIPTSPLLRDDPDRLHSKRVERLGLEAGARCCGIEGCQSAAPSA